MRSGQARIVKVEDMQIKEESPVKKRTDLRIFVEDSAESLPEEDSENDSGEIMPFMVPPRQQSRFPSIKNNSK